MFRAKGQGEAPKAPKTEEFELQLWENSLRLVKPDGDWMTVASFDSKGLHPVGGIPAGWLAQIPTSSGDPGTVRVTDAQGHEWKKGA